MAPTSLKRKPHASTTRSNNPGTAEERATRNPYLNFLKEFRRENGDLNPNEVIRLGAEEWNQLSEAQRRPFVLEAQNQPQVRRLAPRSRSPRRRRSRAGRSRSRSESRRGGRGH